MSVVRTEASVINCPECGETVNTENGEAYCTECGLVVEEKLLNLKNKFSPASSNKDHSSQSSGVGTGTDNKLLHNKGLGSQISFKNKDSNGSKLPSKKRKQLSRLRDWQEAWQYSSNDLTKRGGISEVLRYTDAMDLPRDVKNVGSQLFKDAHDAGVAVGRSVNAIANVAVYIAAKQLGHARQWDEWVKNANVDETLLKNTITNTKEALDVGYLPETPMDMAPQILSELDILDSNRNEIRNLIKAAEENQVHIGRKPQSVVAACIYLGSQYTTQKQAGNAADVTETTIQKTLQEMGDMDKTTGYEYYE